MLPIIARHSGFFRARVIAHPGKPNGYCLSPNNISCLVLDLSTRNFQRHVSAAETPAEYGGEGYWSELRIVAIIILWDIADFDSHRP